MRFPLCVAVLAMSFIVLQCMASGANTGHGSESNLLHSDHTVPVAPVETPPSEESDTGRDTDRDNSNDSRPGANSGNKNSDDSTVDAADDSDSQASESDNRGATVGGARRGTDKEREEEKQDTKSEGERNEHQNPVVREILPSSSTHSTSSQNKQKEIKAPSDEPVEKPADDITILTDSQSKNGKPNNNKDGTDNQGNAKLPTGAKTVPNVTTKNNATDKPKEGPVVITGSENKINLTTTTTMANDIEPTTSADKNGTASTTSLTQPINALKKLQTVEQKDNSGSNYMLFSIGTLFTLGVTAVVPVY